MAAKFREQAPRRMRASGHENMKKTYLYVGSGTWGAAEQGRITVYQLDRATRDLTFLSAVEAGGLASFLAIDQPALRLFAADEDDGGVLSFSIDPHSGALTRKGERIGTSHPVYLTLAPQGSFLLAANYSEGTVEVYPISSDGRAEAPSQTLETGRHTHCVALDSKERALVANKSSDTISLFTHSAGVLHEMTPPTIAHASPRHIAFDPEGRALVVSELADTVSRYTWTPSGELSLEFQGRRLPGSKDAQLNSGADIVVSPSGSFLYGSNRGTSNTIFAYDLRGDSPNLIGHYSSGGLTPRKLAMDPLGEFLVVGNQESKNITIFDIEEDGALIPVLNEPTSVSPYYVTVIEL